MNTISFRKLVKLIHPDVAKIDNASEKMTIAVTFKEHPEILYRKGVEWGVIKSETKFKYVNNWVWKEFLNSTPRLNRYIHVKTRPGIKVMVVKITPKRVYFYINGKKTWCKKENAIVVKKVKVTKKVNI